MQTSRSPFYYIAIIYPPFRNCPSHPFFLWMHSFAGTHTLMSKLLHKLQALEAESVTVATLTASVDRRLRKRLYGEGREPLFRSSKLQQNSLFHASTDIVNVIARLPDGI